MRKFIRSIETLELDGGWLCLDFINTVRNRFEKPVFDYLTGFNEWLLWIKRMKLLSAAELLQVMEFSEKDSSEALKELHKIIETRESLYQLFKSIARDQSPAESIMREFNYEISRSFRKMEIKIDRNRLVEERWKTELPDNKPLFIIIKSAYELLKSDKLHRIKECANCGWLYLDKSKNNSRRWCNMQTCGNSDKSKKYYRKKKGV